MIYLESGEIFSIFASVYNKQVVNINWFQPNTYLAALVLEDLGYTSQTLRVDGRVYRAWVHPQCKYPKIDLDVHLRNHTWEKCQ